MTLRESDLHAHIYARAPAPGGCVRVGPGDDSAVLDLPAGPLLVTTDQFVEGRHYAADEPDIDLIARNSVGRSVSDIAAMGGVPTAAVAAACLRSGETRATELFDAMHRWAALWGCPLVGGDIAIADGPTVLTVTVLGRPHSARGPVLRSTARPGDAVFVTGRLGRALIADWRHPCEPRVQEAQRHCDALGARLTAMIDISDGLGRDAGRIAAASKVRIELDAAAIPLADGLDHPQPWRAAIAAGDDYELCFTASGDVPADARSVGVTRVGRVVEGEGCVVRTPAGDALDASQLGWDHTSP